jgi:cysteinyl-tRNA synthetase
MLEKAREEFITEMDDDFNTAGALGIIFKIVKQGNTYLSTHEGALDEGDHALLNRAVVEIEDLLAALGTGILPIGGPPIEDDIENLLSQRQQARAEKNWELADRLRDEIDALGYVIEDTPQGARVSRKG